MKDFYDKVEEIANRNLNIAKKVMVSSDFQPEDALMPQPNQIEEAKAPTPVFAEKQQNADNAVALVGDVVLKNYLSRLCSFDIAPITEELKNENVRIYKITKMVYEKDEYATDKFISIINSMAYAPTSIFLIVDGKEDHTDFYLGVKSLAESHTGKSLGDTFINALKGQFPGVQIKDLSEKGIDTVLSEQELFIKNIKEKEIASISLCSGIPSYKNSKGEYTNANFIQGIEKFALAMQGKRYTAVILATNIMPDEFVNIRHQYEQIYTDISILEAAQLNWTDTATLTKTMSQSIGKSVSLGMSHNEGENHSDSTNSGTNVGTYAGASAQCAPLGVGGSVYGGVTAGKTWGKGHSDGTNSSDGISLNIGNSTNKSESEGNSKGQSHGRTVTVKNKHVQEMMKRIDKQLERINIAEGTGLWDANAYFLSYKDNTVAETCATIFRSIMNGEQSGVEVSAVNTWTQNDDDLQRQKIEYLRSYIGNLSHPVFKYNNGIECLNLLPTTTLNSKELAIIMGLPRKSVPGFPVVEHISLGKEVVRLDFKKDDKNEQNSFELGCIFDQGIKKPRNKVQLDRKSLTQHTFVTGSTGCGKSETVYKLIDSIGDKAHFLIIEPAKGEYKKVFGGKKDVHVYGTNPLISNLLKINPFKFTKGVHVLEHADRLIEIFNVCWPMYAAMPAVLKEAVLNAYEDSGWDLIKSKNKYSEDIFPTFSDLIWELETVIEASAYSEEVKSNYKGSLVTRVKSLANGINGEIFCGQENGDEKLFDENVIIDISRIGSQETKALIMGILIMRLNEYRANNATGANSDLKHVTILEEAHNILKRCSQEQSMEGSNVAGKSVEMISNAIAEMRTYGEGFIIVDQSPGAVDISAIRNTNTKIIMRLPEDSDRKIAGKSAAMKDNQVDEIAKLPTGVAVVYQNDWEEPVLCKISQFDRDKDGREIEGKRLEYVFKKGGALEQKNGQAVILESLKFLLQDKLAQPIECDVNFVRDNLLVANLPTGVKINILQAIQEFKETHTASIWRETEFEKFSNTISGLLGTRQDVLKIVKHTREFEGITPRLKKLIHERVDDLPEVLDASICQSLMYNYSEGSKERLTFYNAWLQKSKIK